MREDDAFGKQADEARRHLQHHQTEREGGLRSPRSRDVMREHEHEHERQRHADHGCRQAEHQIEARAAADGLVHLPLVALRHVLREVPDAGHRHAERHQVHVTGHGRDQGPRSVALFSQSVDHEGREHIHGRDGHERHHPGASDVAQHGSSPVIPG